MTILIVEDSSIQAEMLRRLLAQQGYIFRSAHDGVQGFAMAQENRLDLVISDVAIHCMDGFELCQKIREDATLGDWPVILLTAIGNVLDAVHGLNAGRGMHPVLQDMNDDFALCDPSLM